MSLSIYVCIRQNITYILDRNFSVGDLIIKEDEEGDAWVNITLYLQCIIVKCNDNNDEGMME